MFQNKTIIITGGSSGIGAATVALFSAAGAKVYILNKDRIEKTLKAVSAFLLGRT